MSDSHLFSDTESEAEIYGEKEISKSILKPNSLSPTHTNDVKLNYI